MKPLHYRGNKAYRVILVEPHGVGEHDGVIFVARRGLHFKVQVFLRIKNFDSLERPHNCIKTTLLWIGSLSSELMWPHSHLTINLSEFIV